MNSCPYNQNDRTKGTGLRDETRIRNECGEGGYPKKE